LTGTPRAGSGHGAARRRSFEMDGHENDNETLNEVQDFIRATGGGEGCYETDGEIKFFNQSAKCKRPKGFHEKQGLGFGRIKFKQDPDPKPYIRVPWNSNDSKQPTKSICPGLLLHFVETVWGLQRPNLLVSITGGATDSLQNSDDLQLVLSDLVGFARRTSAWLTTGGTHAGIMKLVGDKLLCSVLIEVALLCSHSMRTEQSDLSTICFLFTFTYSPCVIILPKMKPRTKVIR
jgi:hypothetical protein